MKLKLNMFRELIYADLFDSPIKIEQKYFCLPGREKLVGLRKKREKYSLEKEKIAVEKANFLKKIPSIEAIFLTGSVAVGNAKKDADIDLMIVTSTNTLWITRFLVFISLKSLRSLRSPKKYKDRICPNIFVDLNHLRVSDENIYTAHEVLQAKPLFDRGGVEQQWLKANSWVKKYLSVGYKHKINKTNDQYPISQFPISNYQIGHWTIGAHWSIGDWIIGLIELCVFIPQYLFMKRKITHERVGWGYAFFHPNDLSKTIPEKFRQRLLKYTEK